MVRLGCHEHECNEPLLAAIEDAVILARGREGNFSGPQFPLLFAHLEDATTFQNIIDLVLPHVRVRTLFLPRLEAVSVAKESSGFEDAVLFHLLRRKLHGIGEFFKVAHSPFLFHDGYYHRVPA